MSIKIYTASVVLTKCDEPVTTKIKSSLNLQEVITYINYEEYNFIIESIDDGVDNITEEYVLEFKDNNRKEFKESEDYYYSYYTGDDGFWEAEFAITSEEIELPSNIIDRDDYVATILWQEEDIASALENNNIPVTQKNIEKVCSYGGTIEDRSIEEGWEIINTIISNCNYDENLEK